MGAEKFLNEWKRMCDACSTDCADCSNECGYVKEFAGKQYDDLKCWKCALLFPDRAVKAVLNWAKAHPQKTRAQDLFEKYPNAPKNDDGIPRVCAAALGYRDFCNVGCEIINCEHCWNQPLE